MAQLITKDEILFGYKLKPEVLKCSVQDFIDEVVRVSDLLMIIPDCLMAVMELETAGTFDPSITNSLGYTGLIQFGKPAARSVGTTRASLRAMDAKTQLTYVYKYFKPHTGKLKSFSDIYLAVFFPAALGKPDEWVLHTSRLTPQRIALWNPLFDENKDQKIQVKEIKNKLAKRIPNSHKWILNGFN
tara:strand:+ start:18109 stop:18669 length:561 start_codon:yes stop_codon:yes gene_type:complete